jgi:hypothetical protein
MKRLGSRKAAVVAGIVTAALAVAGVSAYAAASSIIGSSPGEQVASVEPGPEREARAYGMTASQATPLFTLADGKSAALVANGLAKCLLLSVDDRDAGETCATTPEIAQGHGVSVSDECGSTGKNLMEIIGLAPQAAARVRLLSSDGSSRTAPVLSGAFKFDGTNPAAGEPYPTGLEWVDSSGSSLGTAGLPVHGDEFCLPS